MAAAASGQGGKVESWARNHKGAVALLAGLAAAGTLLLLLVHPKGRSAGQQMLKTMPGFAGGGTAGAGTTPPPTTPTKPADFGFVTAITKARFGLQQGDTGPPVWTKDAAGQFSEAFRIPWGTQLKILGPMQGGWLPVQGPGGAQLWMQEFDIGRWSTSDIIPSPSPTPITYYPMAGPAVSSKAPADVFGGL